MNPQEFEASSDQAVSSASSTEERNSTDLDRASDPALTEDLALALLKRRDLSREAVEQLSKNAAVIKSRKARFALAAHPLAPRRISLRLIREFYTFDLMQFALSPLAAADLKRAADEMLVARVTSITLGERISLARRASGNVAAALLLDKEVRVWQTALENPRLTESGVVRTLARTNIGVAVVEAICRHVRWSTRHEIRAALLRHEKTPLACALEFTRKLPAAQLRDILHSPRVPERIKNYLQNNLREKS